MKTMNKTFDFGKIDWYGRGRRVNKVTVTVRLDSRDDGRPALGISGEIWNGRGTDIVCGGQCLDEIAKYVRDPLFKKIRGWWKQHHLNDMHAGTPAQEKYLAEHRTWRGDYGKDCECLKEAGLLTVELDGKPYTYGHAWLYWPIPDGDLAEIKGLLGA